MSENTTPDYDAIVIGAGISGMFQLFRLRQLGMSVKVLEAGSGVGGTWYWNRYPGARFDSESYSYGYSFSKEVLDEWEWKENFSAQPETLEYCNYIADKFDLRRDIQFNARVTAAHYREADNCWRVTLETGETSHARFLITAVGPLSVPTMPTIPGVEQFKGRSFHTGAWPHEDIDFSDKRVAVIGTGATGVQTIQEVAKTAGHLTVFQRTPNYCAPLHNSPITPDKQDWIRANYDDIFERCRNSHGCFIHDADPRKAMDVSAAERTAFYEQLYRSPGFGIWMGNFRDIFVDRKANATISEFVAQKIRERVKDPVVAEKLVPKDHGFGTRRVPLESGYYEVYNQDNVLLVDIRDTPIERISEKGVVTTTEEYEFDIVIYATGFDAVTGAFDKIDIRGRGGQALKDKWQDGPQTYLGLQIADFPNMLTLVGPHNAATFCNIPRCIEQNVEWVTALMRTMRENQWDKVEATREAETEWTEHVIETGSRLLISETNSWMTGINPNIPGRQTRRFLVYAGGAPAYRDRCDDVAANGYAGFVFN